MVIRMAAKGLKPRLTISESGGKWHIRSETSLKTIDREFIPGQPFEDEAINGDTVQV